MAVSYLERTHKWIKSQGWAYSKIECYISYGIGKGGIRKDAFGFVDTIALDGSSIIAVQSCGADFSPHVKKMTEDPDVAPYVDLWLKSGGRVLLIGWRKVKKVRGGKQMVWRPRIREFTLDDFKT